MTSLDGTLASLLESLHTAISWRAGQLTGYMPPLRLEGHSMHFRHFRALTRHRFMISLRTPKNRDSQQGTISGGLAEHESSRAQAGDFTYTPTLEPATSRHSRQGLSHY